MPFPFHLLPKNMFDWLQNLRKSAAEKDQEAITAYLDGALSDRETAAFELRLRDDADLQREVDAQRGVKLILARTPRLRAPRNFVLDPAVYGRQKPRAVPLTARLYPQLRTATLVATLLFAFVFTLNLWGTAGAPTAQDVAMAPAAESQSAVVEATFVAEEPVEVMVEEAEEIEEMEEAMAEFSIEAEIPPDTDDTVELEIAADEAMIEEEPAEEAGVTMSEAAPVGATSNGVDDGSSDGELIAPRATATPGSSRMSEPEEVDPLATPAPLPTLVPQPSAVESDTAEEAVAAADQGDAGSARDDSLRRPFAPGPGGWLAAVLGAVTILLLGLTLWARRQANRL